MFLYIYIYMNITMLKFKFLKLICMPHHWGCILLSELSSIIHRESPLKKWTALYMHFFIQFTVSLFLWERLNHNNNSIHLYSSPFHPPAIFTLPSISTLPSIFTLLLVFPQTIFPFYSSCFSCLEEKQYTFFLKVFYYDHFHMICVSLLP